MLLTIDIGNTNITMGLSGDDGWAHHWRLQTVADRMPDEYAVLFRDLFRSESVSLEEVERTAIGSVVPPATETIAAVANGLFDSEPLIVGPGIRTGLRISTDNPTEVGADLVANAVAAYARFQTSCIAIDFGTALTFTAVQEPGDLVGVAIAPGVGVAADALAHHTAQLRSVQLVAPPAAIGRNTIHSIQSGIIFGYVGLVESLIARIERELGGPVEVIATGGMSGRIVPLTQRIVHVDPWLTLDGLRIIADRNRAG